MQCAVYQDVIDAICSKRVRKLENISCMIPLAERMIMLAEKHFGRDCEIVLSRLEADHQYHIVDIRNSHITNRAVGDVDMAVGLEVVPGIVMEEGIFNRVTTIRDGKIIRSSSVYLKNENGQEVGMLSFYTNITHTLQMEGFLRQYNGFEQPMGISNGIADVNSLLDHLIQLGQQMIGKPAEEMNKVEKVDFIRFLDEKGAFLITKSGERICELLDISKFTFYSYLEKSRSAEAAEDE